MKRMPRRATTVALAVGIAAVLGAGTVACTSSDSPVAAANELSTSAGGSSTATANAAPPAAGSSARSSAPGSDPSAPSDASMLVGAAKVDVTPAELPERYTGVHDPLFSRAIAIQSQGQKAALITVDAGGISDETWAAVTGRLKADYGIAPENVMLAATHAHSTGRATGDKYADLIVQSVAKALDAAKPARMGFGTGKSYLNVNRNIIDKKTGTWWEGPNLDGPSDKTVAVVSFQTLDGTPIGVYYNYAMHAVTNGMIDMVSADYPGAAGKYIEKSLGGNAVAVFSNGAAGDQNPLFFNQTYELRAIRVKDYAKRGEDISNAMPPGGEGLDRKNPRVAMLLEQQMQLSDSMGQLLGEEVLSVNRDIGSWSSGKTVSSKTSTVSCAGRDRTDKGRAGLPGKYKDGEDVKIRLSVLKVGDLVLAGVNGEIFTDIGQRLIRESPYKETMMTTLTNGRANSGYIYNDEAAGYLTFEVVSSRLKPGCAENAIVNGLLTLIDAA